APRPAVDQTTGARPGRARAIAARLRLDVPLDGRVVRLTRQPEATYRTTRLRVQGSQQRRAASGLDVESGAVLRRGRPEGPGPLRGGARAVRHRRAGPSALRRPQQALASGRWTDRVGRGPEAVARPRADE